MSTLERLLATILWIALAAIAPVIGSAQDDGRSACRVVEPVTESDYPQVEPVDADPAHGFDWPYLMFVPKTLTAAVHPVKAALLVVPNNTGKVSDDPLVHLLGAMDDKRRWRKMATDLNAVLLIPVFPRPANNKTLYTHALGRSAMLTKIPGIERLDLQLIQMMNDLRQREKAQGIEVDQRAYLVGFSASAMFVNRFTFMHPDQVRAAAFGSPGGWPLAPVAKYKDVSLRYPIGVADFREVTGRDFDLTAVAKVPQLVMMGDQDTNDSVVFSDSYEEQDRATVFELLGGTLMARWPIAKELYRENLPLASFKLYPGVAHTFAPEMRADTESFFCQHAINH